MLVPLQTWTQTGDCVTKTLTDATVYGGGGSPLRVGCLVNFTVLRKDTAGDVDITPAYIPATVTALTWTNSIDGWYNSVMVVTNAYVATDTVIAGTVTTVQGSTTVTGVLTDFVAELSPGDVVEIDGEIMYVDSITDPTHFEMTENWVPVAVSGEALTQWPTFSYTDDSDNGSVCNIDKCINSQTADIVKDDTCGCEDLEKLETVYEIKNYRDAAVYSFSINGALGDAQKLIERASDLCNAAGCS